MGTWMNTDERGSEEVGIRVQRSMGAFESILQGHPKRPIDLCPRSYASMGKYNSSVSMNRFERFTHQASGSAGCH
jgi:hypothetical protein